MTYWFMKVIFVTALVLGVDDTTIISFGLQLFIFVAQLGLWHADGKINI